MAEIYIAQLYDIEPTPFVYLNDTEVHGGGQVVDHRPP